MLLFFFSSTSPKCDREAFADMPSFPMAHTLSFHKLCTSNCVISVATQAELVKPTFLYAVFVPFIKGP